MRFILLILIALGVGGGVAGWSLFAKSTSVGGAGHAVAAEAQRFPVTIRTPSESLSVQTSELGWDGRPVTASCTSCHATQTPNPQARSGSDLKEFHQGLSMQHGGLACLSCHNPADYGAFRLADDTKIERANVMQLCAQCHGTQHRDYLNGAHGGMNGFWDLSRGPRQRNNCIDCHDPHAPAFQGMRPAAPPRDRFLTPAPRRSGGGNHD